MEEKNAVVTVGEGASARTVYELNANVVGILLSVRHDTKKFALEIKLRPYATDRLIQLLTARDVYYKPAKMRKDFPISINPRPKRITVSSMNTWYPFL